MLSECEANEEADENWVKHSGMFPAAQASRGFPLEAN